MTSISFCDGMVMRPSVSKTETLQPVAEAPRVAPVTIAGDVRKVAATVKGLVRHALDFDGTSEKNAELSQLEQQIIALAADVMFPKDGGFSLSGTEAGVPAYVEKYFGNMPPHVRRLMHILFHFIELSPLAFGPRRRVFSSLREAEQREAMNFCTKSVYMHRVALETMRVVLTLGYMANDQIAKEMKCVPNKDPFGVGEKDGQQKIV